MDRTAKVVEIPNSTTLATLASLAAVSPNNGVKSQSSEAGDGTLEQQDQNTTFMCRNPPSCIFKHIWWFCQTRCFLATPEMSEMSEMLRSQSNALFARKSRKRNCFTTGLDPSYFSLRQEVRKGPTVAPTGGTVSGYLAKWGGFGENV